MTSTTKVKETKSRSGPGSLPLTASPIEHLIQSRAKARLVVDGVREYVIDIDANLAEQMLATRHPDQRNFRTTLLERLIGDMRGGRYVWEVIDVVRFNTFGQLIDGQHRLEAIRQANMPEEDVTNGRAVSEGAVVLRNVRAFFLVSDGRVAMTVCDGGANRTMPEALKMSGGFTDLIVDRIPTSVVNAVIFAESGFAPEVAHAHSRTTAVDTLYHANRQALNRLIEISQAATVKLNRGHLGAAFACMTRSKDPDAAYRFFKAAFQNIHTLNDRRVPALQALCNQIIKDRDKQQRKFGRATGREGGSTSTDAARAHRCIVYFNRWRENPFAEAFRVSFHGKVAEPV